MPEREMMMMIRNATKVAVSDVGQANTVLGTRPAADTSRFYGLSI